MPKLKVTTDKVIFHGLDAKPTSPVEGQVVYDKMQYGGEGSLIMWDGERWGEVAGLPQEAETVAPPTPQTGHTHTAPRPPAEGAGARRVAWRQLRSSSWVSNKRDASARNATTSSAYRVCQSSVA